jgi:hypothetical protein
VAAPEASARHGDFNLLAEDHTSISRPESKTGRRFYALTALAKTITINPEVIRLFLPPLEDACTIVIHLI